MIHFRWTTYWPHAFVDVTEPIQTTDNKSEVTCRACLHALGSQQQDPPKT